jgi:hypothetical protein
MEINCHVWQREGRVQRRTWWPAGFAVEARGGRAHFSASKKGENHMMGPGVLYGRLFGGWAASRDDPEKGGILQSLWGSFFDWWYFKSNPNIW